MNRTDFRAFCATHSLLTEDAGRDWHDAGVKGAYICTIIDEKDFAASKPLLDNNDAYLASAERKQGQAWFEHRGYGQINANDVSGVGREMADQYARFLSSKGDVNYYNAEDIARRNTVLVDNPAQEGESEETHFERVAEMQDDDLLTPCYVTEAGYWCENGKDLMLSDTEMAAGIWSFSYDNWVQHVILILKEQKNEDDDE